LSSIKFNEVTESFAYGEHTVTIETGVLARQATGAVKVTMGDTVVLVTAVAKDAESERDFFPLTVNYQEKMYACGSIPGSFHRREGRPSERETLICRLIDRPLRPLFDKDFTADVQIVATVLSYDPEVSSDIPSMIGAAAAVSIAGLPYAGPMGAARVGYVNGEYVLNPSDETLKKSDLDLVVAGNATAILMVESEAKELSEEVMLGAVVFGHKAMQVAIDAISKLVARAAVVDFSWVRPEANIVMQKLIKEKCESDLRAAYKLTDKQQRVNTLNKIKGNLVAEVCTEESGFKANAVFAYAHDLEAEILRRQVLDTGIRIDGRDTRTVRPIDIKVGLLPRVHGSAVFTRGETQAIVATTLGTDRDAMLLDSITGKTYDRFMLHYNFPPFSVGEVGMIGSTKRREIGHGWLARRAVTAVLPNMEDFPYVLRVVSDITESNGSSSMATVCGSILAMMDAGVQIKAPVAGIAMGLIKEGNDVAVLTDILGDEDHLGDMDFKVAGSANGVTALQMDIKIQGITEDIMRTALDQAKEGRLHILGKMNEAISSPRSDVSNFAPRITTIKIDPSKIREIIGKGGETIRALTEETNTTIDISDDGVVKISAVSAEDSKAAQDKIMAIVAEPEVGAIYSAKVVKITDFGAFVEFMPGKQGLVHISQVCSERIEKVEDKLSEGQEVKVKLVEIDRQGRVRLSIKAVTEELDN
jgi:polyribonucleotide nucleotidyltransferase